MLRYGQTPIDVSKLSEKAIAITQQLITLSQDYQKRCLVLLDPFLSPIDEFYMQYYQNRLRLHQVRIMHNAISATKCPWLIELDLSDKYEHTMLSYMIDQGLKQSRPESIKSRMIGQQYCAWIFTHKKAQSIADDLAKLAIQGGQKKILLRFYDPAVFFQLMNVLESKQQNILLGHIKIWSMLTREGTLNSHYHQGEVWQINSGELRLTKDQYQLLECIGINNQIINSQLLVNPTKSIDEIASLQTIMPSLIRLKKNNINEEQFQLQWAKLALIRGADFDCEPKIEDKIKQCTNLRQYYHLLDELKAIKTEDWQTYLQTPNRV